LGKEAELNLRRMYSAAASYYQTAHKDILGRPMEPSFPKTIAMTPTVDCCGLPGDRCNDDPTTWQPATWAALNFTVTGPHVYRYEFVSSGTGKAATFTARAVGDPDCDQRLDFVELTGTIKKNGKVSDPGVPRHGDRPAVVDDWN
jgi:hypothetical protein